MKIFRFLLFFLLLAASLVGCSAAMNQGIPPDHNGETFTLTDGLAREVSLEGISERIVSLAPSNTELLFDVDAGGQVVGRDSFSDYPEQALGIQDIGGSMGLYDFEAIAALEPDLVLAAEINTPEQVRSLENLGLTVYYLPNPHDFDGLYQNIRTVGLLTGRLVESETLVKALQERVSGLQARLVTTDNLPTVYYELDATDPALPYTIGQGTFGDYLITLARGTNVGARIGEGWVQISIEDLLVSDPGIILLGDVYAGVTPESVVNRPGWSSLSAVQFQQVFPFDDDLISRPTARLVDGFEALVRLLHPEVFVQ